MELLQSALYTGVSCGRLDLLCSLESGYHIHHKEADTHVADSDHGQIVDLVDHSVHSHNLSLARNSDWCVVALVKKNF